MVGDGGNRAERNMNEEVVCVPTWLPARLAGWLLIGKPMPIAAW